MFKLSIPTMKKPELIKLVDFLSFLGLLVMMSTGMLLKFSLPPRSGGNSIWGMTRHDWGDIHFYASVVFLLLMTGHLFLHLKFIKTALRGRASRESSYRLAVGLACLIVLLALLFAPLVSPVSIEGRL